jgi:MoxR-like ATPase
MTYTTETYTTETYTQSAATLRNVLFEIKKAIVGQDLMLERILVALIARGHVLIEGVPGLAKTMTIKTASRVIGGQFKRVQFTPDLVPADLIGTRIYNQQRGAFEIELGPIFANLVLADEINRAPAKVQSALLEAMQERQVTIGRETFKLPEPFLVLATQNPIESEGTYPLPEAQLDRFMFKVVIGYPSIHEEIVVVERGTSRETQEIHQVISAEQLAELQHIADAVYVHPRVMEYAVNLAVATRDPGTVGLPDLRKFVSYGASPRAPLNLVLGAKALAVLRGREYALPEDVRDLSFEVLRHRFVLSYEALAENMTTDALLQRVLERVSLPKVHIGDPHGDARADTETARA